jgi:sigma-B regulation protein RsbU (phosphoserine phosphatase)
MDLSIPKETGPQAEEPRRRTGNETRSQQFAFLAEAAEDLNSSLDLERVFEKIARRVGELVDSHLFCVMLWNEKEQVLEHSYSLKFGRHVQQEGSFPLGHGLTGTCARLRCPVRVGDVTGDARYIRFRHAEVDVRSELAVPLLLRDRLVGVLDLESLEPDRFTAEHEQMLTALGSHIASALENARLYGRMVQLERRRARELDIARKIQEGLLPDQVPRVPGCEVGSAFAPARELAGDFYDYLQYHDGCVGFAVGDVAGKATGAALYGALAVGLLRGHAMENPYSPAEMLHHLNEHLGLIRTDNRFLAMSIALFNPANRDLILGGAAFPWPRRVRDGQIEVIEVAGLPLGLFDDPVYKEVRVTLRPGDVIVIGSDGLEDCLLERGDGVTEDDLARWIRGMSHRSAQTIADALIAITDPLAEAGGDVRPADDRTVLVLKGVEV